MKNYWIFGKNASKKCCHLINNYKEKPDSYFSFNSKVNLHKSFKHFLKIKNIHQKPEKNWSGCTKSSLVLPLIWVYWEYTHVLSLIWVYWEYNLVLTLILVYWVYWGYTLVLSLIWVYREFTLLYLWFGCAESTLLFYLWSGCTESTL